MGLNLSRPTPSQPQPSQGQAPAAPQEEESYQQYDISADRQMMTQTLVNSPEVDALASHGTPARRQEILKDPHIGAFGVIRLCGYFLLSFALWTTLAAPVGKELCLSFCLSRCLSGWAVARFPLAKHSGLAYTFATAADRKRVAWILLLAGVGLGGIVCWKSLAGGAMVLAALLVFWDYWRRSRKYFGGLSGDLAGWFLQRVELWMLAAVWIVDWGAHLL